VRHLRGATGDGDQPGESGETATAGALSSPAVSGSNLLGGLGRARRYVHLARASGANTLCAGQTALALGVITLWHIYQAPYTVDETGTDGVAPLSEIKDR
jgi:hypothetical protein